MCPEGTSKALQGLLGDPVDRPSVAVARPAAPGRGARNDLYLRHFLLRFRPRSDPSILALHPGDQVQHTPTPCGPDVHLALRSTGGGL